MGGTAGLYTMLALAWWNAGFYPSCYAAQAGNVNFGDSGFFIVNVTEPPGLAPDTMFPSFTVQNVLEVPEPATLAIAALTLAMIFFLRARAVTTSSTAVV